MKKAAVPSILVAVVLLALGVIAEAQQTGKVPRIGYLSNTDPATESNRSEAIRLVLRERGYIDGQNIAFEYRYAEGKRERASDLLAETTAASVRGVKEVLPVAARALKLTIQPLEVRAADDFERVFAAISKWHPDGLYVPAAGPLMGINQTRIVGFALKSRLPSMYSLREFVDAGGLMYYGVDLADSYRRVAYFVDRILKGAKPADLPVEQPTKFELVINLKTVKQIGVTIPQSLLYRADKVIKESAGIKPAWSSG